MPLYESLYMCMHGDKDLCFGLWGTPHTVPAYLAVTKIRSHRLKSLRLLKCLLYTFKFYSVF
jgi:hypothetical protein